MCWVVGCFFFHLESQRCYYNGVCAIVNKETKKVPNPSVSHRMHRSWRGRKDALPSPSKGPCIEALSDFVLIENGAPPVIVWSLGFLSNDSNSFLNEAQIPLGRFPRKCKHWIRYNGRQNNSSPSYDLSFLDFTQAASCHSIPPTLHTCCSSWRFLPIS